MIEPRAVVLYIAASLDGFIAPIDRSTDWLKPYETEDYGYGAFIERVSSIVMGRRTFDQVAAFDSWPYEGKRVVVLTGRPIEAPPEGVYVSTEQVDALTAHLRSFDDGDIWLCGGGEVIAQFFEHDLIDRLELFLIPVVLGEGVPLFREGTWRALFALQGAQAYDSGVAGLSYLRERGEAPSLAGREPPEEPDEPII